MLTNRLRISISQFRLLSIIACFFIAAIIVTGASVRVTGSGLGCETWPKCTSESFLPHDSSSYHPFVEFGNRLFTGLLSISVIVCVGASIFREPRSKRLIWLSWSLVAGVIAQIILGGITVLVGLHPLSVASHFLLSCLILSSAIVLSVVSIRKDTPSLKGLFKFGPQLYVLLLSYLVVIFGTVVTAAGPHAGDEEVPRFDAAIETVARIHSFFAWFLLALILYLVFAARDRSKSLIALLITIIIQGAWGYTQYALSVPAWMVLVHVLLATVLFVFANLYWTTSIMQRNDIRKL